MTHYLAAMKSMLLYLFLFCCIHSFSAQSVSDSDIDLLSAELSKQAISRNTLKLAVLDFTESNAVTDFALAVSEELRIHMAVNNASLTIIDRAATEQVMEEQRLSSSPLFDENKAASLGKLVSADAIVTGTIIRQGGSWRVTASVKGDLTSRGVAEITSTSASEKWYYWFSSMVQLRYQL